jgi:hypothetical protein
MGFGLGVGTDDGTDVYIHDVIATSTIQRNMLTFTCDQTR